MVTCNQQLWPSSRNNGRMLQIQPSTSWNCRPTLHLTSAANFNLGNVAQAETSVTRGLRLDPNHRLPRLEYLYGMILARRGDYKAAVEHMQTYLRLSPNASDAADAQNKLAQLQKLAASENLATR